MKTLRIISGSLLAASLGCVATAQAAPTSATLAANFIAAGGSTGSGTVGPGDLVVRFIKIITKIYYHYCHTYFRFGHGEAYGKNDAASPCRGRSETGRNLTI